MVAQCHAARNLNVDQLIVRGLRAHEFTHQRQPTLAGVRIGDTQLGQAALQACHVLIKAKQTATINRDHFVHTIAEDESSIEHRHLRIAKRQGLAVQMAKSVRKRQHVRPR